MEAKSFWKITQTKLMLSSMFVLFIPVLYVRYVTSPIVNCNGSTCPEAFSIVEAYSPINLFVTGFIQHARMDRMTLLPISIVTIVLAFLAGYFAISLFDKHRLTYQHHEK